MSLPDENKKHTYADYKTWPEHERWEIIDGVPYMQSAAPRFDRQNGQRRGWKCLRAFSKGY